MNILQQTNNLSFKIHRKKYLYFKQMYKALHIPFCYFV